MLEFVHTLRTNAGIFDFFCPSPPPLFSLSFSLALSPFLFFFPCREITEATQFLLTKLVPAAAKLFCSKSPAKLDEVGVNHYHSPSR